MDDNYYFMTKIGPNFTNLPMEIIYNILSYLPPSDILAASQTCRLWYEATLCPKFSEQITLNFHRVPLCDSERPLSDFERDTNGGTDTIMRPFNSIVMTQCDFIGNVSNHQFWQECSSSIESITFRICDIRERSFNGILKRLTNLKHIEIDNCRELFMSGRLFDSEVDAEEICQACIGVTALSLSHNRYLSDALFNRIVDRMPQLEQLNLCGSNISFHHGLYRKFYPGGDRNLEPSESVLTFYHISKFIDKQSPVLTELDFSYTLIDGQALTQLADMTELQLKTLKLKSCDQLTNPGIVSLVELQPNLQHLDLSMSVRLTDACLIDICTLAPQLTVLKLRRCRAITDLGVTEIFNLKSLTVLDVSECVAITSRGITNGLAREKNLRMRELHVSALNICEQAVIRIVENLPNLRLLDISYCKHGVTNLAVQLMFKNLRWLRTLNLEYCDQISDAGLVGLNMQEQLKNYENEKQANKENTPDKANVRQSSPNDDILNMLLNLNNDPEPFKISLRSRAEQEIVNDAMRKKLMLQLYERQNDQLAIKDLSGYSIERLRGLKSLRLTACNKITDVSLKFSFRLPELRDLSIAKCQQISHMGIEALVKNSPAIESLNLTECHNINDKTIDLITVRLKRLTHLHLMRCIQLTDHSLDSITVNCQMLKYIDVQGCRAMCAEPNLRLVSMTTLKEIHMSKPGPYVNEPADRLSIIKRAGMNASSVLPIPPPFPSISF